MMATATATTTTNKVCLNVKCCATSSTNWKPGWLMRSGRIADLCDSCGLAYEQLRFCETFHADDAGWRTCNSCKKRVHCGCIASIYSFILLDTGGVECISCAKKNNSTNTNPNSINHFVTLSGKNLDSSIKDWTENIGGRFPWTTESGSWFPFPFSRLPSTPQAGVPHWQQLPETDRLVESDRIAENSTGEMTSAADSNKAEEDSNEKFKDDSKNAEVAISVQPTRLEFLDGDSLREDAKANIVDVDAKVFTDSDAAKDSNSQEHFVTGNVDAGTALRLGKPDGQVKSMPENAMDFHDSSALAVSKVLDPAMDQLEPHPSSHLAMSLGLYPAKDDASEANERAGSSAPTTFTGSAGTQGDSRDHVKFSGLSSVRHRQRQLLPKPPQSQPATRAEISKESSMQVPIRVARPPGEGRGRNQLLPRYWPRITDQELQQITSGGSNSTITPLFEKMLSASDAGRIGRLVLPKACAEAYFPSISQPEGLPLKIQDVSGKEWVFQFRFWPNNNSRMYVLEGVTPCIQSMQLQAGDTVTFSRLDPEGKLVMGYRRAPNSLSTQDVQTSTTGTSTAAAHLDAGGIDNIPTITGLPGLLPQSLKSGSEPQFNGLSGKFNITETGYGWFKSEKAGTRPKEGALYQSLLLGDRRKGRHLGSKSKRLRMEVEESIELKLSWEEAQDLLRPPPNIVPNIVTIDGHEFEEYEEPPVFGKRTIFTTRQSGLTDDQWAQCDDCGSWRKVPPNVFLPTRWTCADNAWDSKRAACIAPQEVNSEEIENLLRHTKDVKKQEDTEPQKVNETSSGLDALANAATLGDNNTASSSSPAPTTKHPRHRPGCTCIVCIQPPSGKGPKHKPTCVCNVCMTVKRRFKTLMMRRKKRQTEREAETARKKRAWVKEEGEVNSGTKWRNDTYSFPENGSRQGSLAATFPGSLPRINSFSANGNGFTSSVALTSTYPSRAKAAGEDCLASKGHIDLNSKPERDDEQSKGTGRQSMVKLLQNASYPLDKYMKQQGLTSLICPQQMLVAPMGFARNVSSRRVDEYTGSQSALLTPDKSQEEPFLVLGGARGDTATSAQSFEIMERKSSIQVPNQSS